MLVSVIYYDPTVNGYCGNSYTYKTKLPLKMFNRVIAPTMDGDKKALVVGIDLPESVIDKAWAWKLKEIKELDKG